MGEAQWRSAFSSSGKKKAQWKKEQWRKAFRKQDGYRLLILLRENPDLLLVTYCGCNVLHLAIRKRWYGLVREVLLKFCPLRTRSIYESSSSRSRDTQDLQSSPKSSSSRSRPANPGEDTQHLQSSPTEYLSQDQFWLLLEGKEPVDERSSSTEDKNWKYRSGLDVLAMAVIQGHGAINTILAEAVQTVGGAPHHYAGVIRFMDGKTGWKNNYSSSERREVLRNIMEKCFTDGSTENQVDKRNDLETANDGAHAPASATGSQASPSGSGPNLQQRRLEDKIDAAWKKEWMVTSPFLPFEEFLFLACCLHTSTWQGNFSDYGKVRSARAKVLECCAREIGDDLGLRSYLVRIRDTWGRAIHHAVHAEETGPPHARLSLVLKFMRPWVNSRDSSGRTPLHTALALGLEDPAECLLAESELWHVEAFKDTKSCGRWEFGGGVCEIDVKAVSGRNGYSPHESSSQGDRLGFHSILRSPHLAQLVTRERRWMTYMIRAAYEGDVVDLQYMASEERFYDAAMLHNLPVEEESRVPGLLNCSALHVAAAAGHPQAIRAILASGKFDPLVEDWEGNTALHHATHFELPLHFPHSLADFCVIPDRRIGNPYTAEFALERKELLRTAESRRQGCINLLLQAGIDVWQTNKNDEIADPGSKCSPEYSTWWYEKMSKETQEAKSSLNAGANAISVTAALVATASYVGPLQPPLGYAAQSEGLTEKIQVGDLTVRIFIVCNTLAFYLALAAIMLSLTPLLPMPRESMLDELKLVRRAVTTSVGLLIMSILAVLVAFASASIAVIPDEDSWNHGGLTISTIGVGGFICSLVLLLCLFRLLRLTFHRQKFVRILYKKYVCM